MTARSLVVCLTNPWPITSGARRRIALMAEACSERGPVDVFYFAGPSARPLDGVPAWVDRIGCARRPMPLRSTRAAAVAATARAYWRRAPRHFGTCRSEIKTAEQAVLSFVGDATYDVVLVVRQETLQFVGSLLAQTGSRHVIDVDDLEDRKLLLQRSHLRSWGLRRGLAVAALSIDAMLWRRMHRRLLTSGGVNLVCTQEDARHLESLGVRSHVVPNAYTERPRYSATPARRATGHAVFVGSPYLPNRSALRFLCQRVVPRIRQTDPSFTLHVVGRLEGAADDGVVYHGFVNDLGELLHPKAIAVIPVFAQSGTSIKVLDAAARGAPIVATGAAVRGTGFRDGVHYLRADTADEFVDRLARMRSDPVVAACLADNARTQVTRRFAPDAVRRRLLDVITDTSGDPQLDAWSGDPAEHNVGRSRVSVAARKATPGCL